MLKEQLTLIDGVRVNPPACYLDVIVAMETVIEIQPDEDHTMSKISLNGSVKWAAARIG